MTHSKKALFDELVKDVLALSPDEAEKALLFCRSLGDATPYEEKPTVNLSFSTDDARKLSRAAEEMQYCTSAAANVFDLLYKAILGGVAQDDPGVVSVMELSARAFKSLRNYEGDQMEALSNSLRHELKEAENANQ